MAPSFFMCLDVLAFATCWWFIIYAMPETITNWVSFERLSISAIYQRLLVFVVSPIVVMLLGPAFYKTSHLYFKDHLIRHCADRLAVYADTVNTWSFEASDDRVNNEVPVGRSEDTQSAQKKKKRRKRGKRRNQKQSGPTSPHDQDLHTPFISPVAHQAANSELDDSQNASGSKQASTSNQDNNVSCGIESQDGDHHELIFEPDAFLRAMNGVVRAARMALTDMRDL